MQTTLTLMVKHVYGKRLYYPDCTQSKLITSLLGSKTITASSIITLEKLGFKINLTPFL